MLLLAELLVCFYCVGPDTEKVCSFYFHVCVVTFPELVLIACRDAQTFEDTVKWK